MQDSSSARKTILSKIKQALKKSVPAPFENNEVNTSFFVSAQNELDVEFANHFIHLLGKFSFCLNKQELVQQLQELIIKRKWNKIFCAEDILKKTLLTNNFNVTYSNDLTNCNAAISSCELLIARTGSILLSSTQQSGRTASIYAPVHICIAYSNQLVYDIKDGLLFLKEKYNNRLPSLVTFATGPSRTADIEKTLVTGVHGPKEVFCFLVEVV